VKRILFQFCSSFRESLNIYSIYSTDDTNCQSFASPFYSYLIFALMKLDSTGWRNVGISLNCGCYAI